MFTCFRICFAHKALENIAKVGEHDARVQHWLEFVFAYYRTP